MPRKKKPKRKSKFWKIFACVIGVMGILAIAQYVYKAHNDKVAHFVYYNDFGIDMPDNFPIHGIDVSTHQDKIDWAKVKAMQSQNIKIGFVFIKATEGLSNVDKAFQYNWSSAYAAGIPRGAYHFFIAGKSGVLQAQNFIKNVRLTSGDLPPVVDIEELYKSSPKVVRGELHNYLSTIENYYHIKPVIYSYATFYNDYLDGEFDDYPLWVAHYFEEHKPRIKRHWNFWQHSENGHVYGIREHVDFSVFNGDSAAFKNFLLP
ncbi:glycoside hydrolase [Arachidicoccus ginsenosidimutans]|uniref:glycoside hydrolase family 25 protein n=1 Tax=Arachidicoccus sp. BS20 TaxID=1850526 RepID=UPI0007F0BE2B|nr:GH25 family lysozyme [Arachidicoccus sp. BS20]ANI88111.1 glycoside hydrolase [Arachidicoccus sp. BS20]